MSESQQPGLDPTLTLRPQEPHADRRVGAYRILRELGHGGMGTVFLATRADEQFEKRVAIKVVRGPDSDEVLRYFRRERQILAGLEHPNIARLLDGGTTDDGLPYFVLEYVEGDPIDTYCDERKLGIRERLRLFEGVCAAVQYAHRSLVVHRDLKPANMLVTSEGVPKLLDFGIAKLLNPGVAGASAETVIAMTPDYASPEQVRGRPITTSTDVYSLGVVLYELLTGRRPYRVASGLQLDILKAVCDSEPERPSTAVGRTEVRTLVDGTTKTTTPEDASRLREDSPDRLRRRLRGDLDAIVLSALQKDPSQRYRSVEALSDDIRRYLEGLPVKAREANALYRFRKLASRHRFGFAAAGAIASLLVAMAVTMAVQAARVRKERDRATAEATKASAINAFLQDALGAADPWGKGARNISLLDALHQAQAKAETTLLGQPLVEASVLETIGVTFANLDEFQEADKALQTAYELRVAAAGPRSIETASSLSALSVLYKMWRKYGDAEKYAREALAITREVHGPKSVEAAVAMNDLAVVLVKESRLSEAKALAEEMLQIARTRSPATPSAVASTVDAGLAEINALRVLGTVAYEQGDFKATQSYWREALELTRARYPGRNLKLAMALNDSSLAQMATGDLAGAEKNYQEVIDIDLELLGPDSGEAASARENLANVYYRAGRLKESAGVLEQVLAIRRKVYGDDSEPVARTLSNMGSVYAKAGNLEAAERSFRESLETMRRKLGPENLDVSYVLAGLGNALMRQKKFDEADADMRQALDIRLKVLGESNAVTQKAIKALAELNTAWGKPAQAAAYTARLTPPH